MGHYNLIMFLILLIMKQCTHFTHLQYIGDESFEQHLGRVCHSSADLKVIIVENVLLAGVGHKMWKNTIYQHLQRLNCTNRNVLYYNLLDLDALGIELLARQHLHYEPVQVVLDVSSVLELSEASFVSALSGLSRFYVQCLKCLPVLVLLDVALDRLERWSVSALHGAANLQAVLVSVSTVKQPETLHFRPTLDGCLLHEGLLMARDKLHFERLRARPDKCDLKYMVTLNVTVNHYIPFCDIVRSTSGQVSVNYGFEIEILRMLESKLRFRAHLVDGRQVWGAKENGSWVGTLNQVLNKSSNMALCCVSRTVAREEVVDFSEMTHLDEITFAVRSPGLITEGIILGTPFQPPVWLLIALTFLGLALTLQSINRIVLHLGRACPSYSLIYLNLLAIYLNKSVYRMWRVQSNPKRLIYLVWMWGALILAIAYCARLYSLLAVPHPKKTIDTVQEVVHAAKHDNYFLVAKKNSSLWYIFMEAKEENNIYYLIGEHIKRTKLNIFTASDEALIKAAESSAKNIAVGPRLNLQIFRHLYANRSIHLGSETISMDFISVLLPKKSPLKRPFNQVISKARNLGLIDKWLTDALNRLPAKTTPFGRKRFNENTSHKMRTRSAPVLHRFNLQDFHTIFTPWFIGNAIAFCLLLLEAAFCIYRTIRRQMPL